MPTVAASRGFLLLISVSVCFRFRPFFLPSHTLGTPHAFLFSAMMSLFIYYITLSLLFSISFASEWIIYPDSGQHKSPNTLLLPPVC